MIITIIIKIWIIIIMIIFQTVLFPYVIIVIIFETYNIFIKFMYDFSKITSLQSAETEEFLNLN